MFHAQVCCVVLIALVALGGCVRHKPITNEDVRGFAKPGTSRTDLERDLRDAEAEYLCRSKEELDTEIRSPELEWQSPESATMCLGLIRDVRSVYYMLSFEHIAFEIELNPQGMVTASRVYNDYTGP